MSDEGALFYLRTYGDEFKMKRLASITPRLVRTTPILLQHMAQPIPDKTFTAAELLKNDGRNSTPIYISLKGIVFDVSKGSDFYGVGTNELSFTTLIYNVFAGHDATYGLAKMSLEPEDLDKDANGLTPDDMASVDKFYALFMQKYVPVGKLVGSKM